LNKFGNILINSLLVLSLTTVVLINISSKTVQSVEIQDVVFSRDPVEGLVEELVFGIIEEIESSFYDNDHYLTQEWDFYTTKVEKLLVYLVNKDIVEYEIGGRNLESIKDEKIKKFFEVELDTYYERLANNGVICSVANVSKSNGSSYPPNFDSNTGLTKLDEFGKIIYKSSKKKMKMLTYDVACTYIDSEDVVQALDYDFSYVFTSWDVLIKEIDYIAYNYDGPYESKDDFYPIICEVLVYAN